MDIPFVEFECKVSTHGRVGCPRLLKLRSVIVENVSNQGFCNIFGNRLATNSAFLYKFVGA